MVAEEIQAHELLDRSTLETLFSLGERRGKDLLGQLFGLFLEQGPKSFASLGAALDAGDASEVKAVAHSLKGSYRSLGVPRLAEISRRLEEDGAAGNLERGPVLLTELEKSFEQTRVALKAFLEEKKSS